MKKPQPPFPTYKSPAKKNKIVVILIQNRMKSIIVLQPRISKIHRSKKILKIISLMFFKVFSFMEIMVM